jgi:hypothetical protein
MPIRLAPKEIQQDGAWNPVGRASRRVLDWAPSEEEARTAPTDGFGTINETFFGGKRIGMEINIKDRTHAAD